MTFKLDDYVDVASRIREFAARYPEGSLQSEVSFVDGGVLCRAYAYRTAADERPGVGHAFEPVPGKTPYTRDSEVMNAETSAWGRAIVALGFETKKIASADEVRNRSAGEPNGQPKPVGAVAETAAPIIAGSSAASSPASTFVSPVERAQAAQPPEPADNPANEEVTFGKHKGLRVGDVPHGYLRWLADSDPSTPDGHRVKAAARAVLGREFIGAGVGPSDDIPFAWTWA